MIYEFYIPSTGKGDVIDIYTDKCPGCGLTTDFVSVFPDVILMQYTGLKDKNGKEIYEGDVVKTSLGIGKVCMRLGCWFIEMQKELGYFHTDEIEVIGNIYENPELLKEVKE